MGGGVGVGVELGVGIGENVGATAELGEFVRSPKLFCTVEWLQEAALKKRVNSRLLETILIKRESI